MGLEKAIKSGKEHRKEYHDSRQFDTWCRCHGKCSWCRDNRLHSKKINDIKFKQAIDDFEMGDFDLLFKDNGLPKIGPFFYIKGHLISSTCELSEGRRQADKIDNSIGHDELFERHFLKGDYIDFPRGRVIWDEKENDAIIYIDPCINKPEVIEKIAKTFNLDKYRILGDEHYHCKNCVGKLFD